MDFNERIKYKFQLLSGCNCNDVNNIVKGRILFSNQDLIEKNEEIVHRRSNVETILRYVDENEWEFLGFN
jgi:hypothetical protein